MVRANLRCKFIATPQWSKGLIVDLVFAKERWTADHKQPERACAGVRKRVSIEARNEYGVTPGDITALFAYGHRSGSFKDVIDLFDLAVMINCDRRSWRKKFLCKTALGYR